MSAHELSAEERRLAATTSRERVEEAWGEEMAEEVFGPRPERRSLMQRLRALVAR